MEEVELTASTLSKSVAEFSTKEVSLPTLGHCIYKVPKQLAGANMKPYQPEMVPIGPFHRNKNLVKTMGEHKLSYLHSLLQRKPNVPVESYISAIKDVEKEARECYAEPINLTSVEFIDMLVLDGCFILEFLRQPGVREHPYISSRLRNGMHRDLILIGNQIPFFVLCTLFDLIEGRDQRQLLMECLKNFCRKILPGDVKLCKVPNLEGVKHILDFVHTSLCPPNSSPPDTRVPITPSTSSTQLQNSACIIPTATELRDSNIKFIRKQGRHTALFDVEFEEKFVTFLSAEMLMPTLVIEHTTESLLRNLIAFEQHFPNDKPTPFIDYALLLDCLINSAKDVRILSRHGIIENNFGSDEMVADFVNQLTLNIIYSNHNFKYAEIFHRVNAHHKNPWNRNVVVGWNKALAEFRRNYFRSPWTCISAVAAFVLLVLTVVQTVFAALEYSQVPTQLISDMLHSCHHK